MKKVMLLSGVMIIAGSCCFRPGLMAQSRVKMSVDEYINAYSDMAVGQMKEYGIPASITLAQGILESGSGNSELALKANNHFGIKCHSGWEGKTFHMDDDHKNECFRKYASVEDSYHDHSVFLTTRPRYAPLFELDPDDYKGWARGLKQAGYATNPRYPDLLIRIIEENRLYLFDQGQQARAGKGKKESETDDAPAKKMLAGDPGQYKVAGAPGGRTVYLNNGVKFIIAREGETAQSIAGDFGIYSWQVRKYNELGKDDGLSAGEMVYLEKKKRKCEMETHQLAEGEDMRFVSQRYGIRLSSLCRMNGMEQEEKVPEGTVVRLK